MPFINSKISVALSDAQEQEIKSSLGQASTAIPGKSESWLMVGFEPNCSLYFKGEKSPKIAFVDVSVYGSASKSARNAIRRVGADSVRTFKGALYTA